jgi:hypothetical protein
VKIIGYYDQKGVKTWVLKIINNDDIMLGAGKYLNGKKTDKWKYYPKKWIVLLNWKLVLRRKNRKVE